MEFSTSKAGKPYRALISNNKITAQLQDNFYIVHLHGYIKHFDIENVRDDCILDYNSNLANKVYDGEWATLLRADMSNADIVVFIGYSLYDPEIVKLIKSFGIKEKTFFINASRVNQ